MKPSSSSVISVTSPGGVLNDSNAPVVNESLVNEIGFIDRLKCLLTANSSVIDIAGSVIVRLYILSAIRDSAILVTGSFR